MSQSAYQVCEQQHQYTECRTPKVEGLSPLPYLPTGYFREHVVDGPKNDHAEETVNALIEVELVDNRELGELGHGGQGEDNAYVAGDRVGKSSEDDESQGQVSPDFTDVLEGGGMEIS